MRIAILGGTAFLSSELARQALAAGHDVHLVARGESGTAPDGAHWHRADREAGVAALDGLSGDFDAVVDVTRQPHHAAWALEALADRAAHWTLVSSCSVYAAHDVPEADETSDLLEPLPAGTPMASMEEYGPAKVRCELEVLGALPERAHISRPGLLVGPGDPSDRFGYWPARLARGGRVLPPRGEAACSCHAGRPRAPATRGALERAVLGRPGLRRVPADRRGTATGGHVQRGRRVPALGGRGRRVAPCLRVRRRTGRRRGLLAGRARRLSVGRPRVAARLAPCRL